MSQIFYKAQELSIHQHRRDEIKCGNCKNYVDLEHKCYMLKKDIKPHSEKYMFFYFESKQILPQKHIVNYCIAHYFTGEERKFTKCKRLLYMGIR